MHSLTIPYMVYSTRMRTLDRWYLSVVLRKSSILKNVVPFDMTKVIQINGSTKFILTLTCKIIVIHNHSK